MAEASIAFIDTSAHPAAVPFFGVFPDEPTPKGYVTISPKISDIRDRRVDKLLELITKRAKPGSSLVIVAHGNKQGILLNIGNSKNQVQLDSEVIAAIRRNSNGKSSDSETAHILKLSESEFGRLKSLISSVQELQLDRVDLRACNVGANDVLLSQFQVFFNCQTACAPVIYDAFGLMKFGMFSSDSMTWKKWIDKHPGATLTGQPPNRMALHASYQPNFMIEVLADSTNAAKIWASTYLPPGKYSGGPLYFHGLTPLVGLPVFAGEEGYRAKLVEAYKGHEPSRTIDLKNMPLLP